MAHQNNHDDPEKMALALARAARIRAARAFADLDQAAFAQALGVSVVTVKRMERGTRETTLDDLHLLADLCGVPREFMEAGFTPTAGGEIVTSEIRELRAAFIDALDTRMNALTEALLTRDEALVTARHAIERLRQHNGED